MSDNESEYDEPQYEVQFDDEEKKDRYLRRDGKATAKFMNNDTYVGEYMNGKRHGYGVYTFANGARYEGDYREGKKDGRGKFLTLDGGRYDGEWRNDVREGEGTYSYPNGDFYKGEWKNNKKHGKGVYTYAKISKDTASPSPAAGNSIEGVWHNGQLLHGTWLMHDGSKYVGNYHKLKPQGSGLFFFSTGHKEIGEYTTHRNAPKWNHKSYTATAANTVPPEPVQPSGLDYAARQVEKAVLKVDHFEGIYRLKKEVEGCPNLRRIGDSLIFGTGQPTLDGFRLLADYLNDQAGTDKVLWINMRNEPVIYVNDSSFAPRHRKQLNVNMEFNNLNTDEIHALEKKMVDSKKKEVDQKDMVFTYYRDTYAENPIDRKNLEITSEVKGELAEAIRTVPQVYDYLNEEGILDVQYARLPIVDERSPSVQDYDTLLTLLRNAEAGTAIIFNCQMGKGRTTIGTTIAYLVRKVLDRLEEGEGGRDERDDENDGEGGEDGAQSTGDVDLQEYDDSDPNYKMGQYHIIMKLVKLLKNGEVVKAEVDEAIDRCKAMQNLRECINYCKEMYDKESGSDERQIFWKTMSIHFLERYYYLLCFYAYIKEHAEKEFDISFAQWCQQHQDIIDLLGSRDEGGLADFEWQ